MNHPEHRRTRLYLRRREAGITLRKLATLAKVHVGALSSYERGLSEPKAQRAVRIAKALNSTVEELFSAEVA